MSHLALPSQQVGDLTITAINDGDLTASLELLSNIEAGDAARLQSDAGEHDHSAVHINCYLVTGLGHTVLIDAGAGGVNGWGGQLKANLSLAGVHPSAIDTILMTHAHPDHVGGLIDADGAAAFPNAELFIHGHEVDFWQDDENLNAASDRARGNFMLARRVLERYRPRIQTFTAGEVLPGLEAVPLPGHTAGHCGFRVESGDKSLLVWGDIVHFPHVQIARPDVSIAFDQDPVLAAHTRLRVLDQVSSDQTLIAGMHLGQPGFGRIARAAEGYELVYDN